MSGQPGFQQSHKRWISEEVLPWESKHSHMWSSRSGYQIFKVPSKDKLRLHSRTVLKSLYTSYTQFFLNSKNHLTTNQIILQVLFWPLLRIHRFELQPSFHSLILFVIPFWNIPQLATLIHQYSSRLPARSNWSFSLLSRWTQKKIA